MEMIGNPQVFAVQLGRNPSPTSYKPWMYGVFSVCVCGERLGSPSDERLDGWCQQLPEPPGKPR